MNLAPVIATILVALIFSVGCRREQPVTGMPAPLTIAPALVDPWKEAALKVEEDRGEPVGRDAKIEIPRQLKHYSDRRRFLGIQVAEWRKHRFHIPHDFADLVMLIRQGEIVELPALGQDYILYGVGFSASDELFTHYDKASGQSVPLYSSDAELQQERDLIADSLKQIEEAINTLKNELLILPKSERVLRATFRAEVAEKERYLTALKKRQQLLNSFYKDNDSRRFFATEYESLASLARNFGERTYDLNDAASRKAFKVRLLSFLRPAALRVLEELAHSYKEKFERHLPVTSLIRPDEYQRQLRETNPNATLTEVPPHTTGLAFDVYYRYMNAAEQHHIMADLARLQDEGKVEALRELRDHFHVFIFADGQPPDESGIKQTLINAGDQLIKRKRGITDKARNDQKIRKAR